MPNNFIPKIGCPTHDTYPAEARMDWEDGKADPVVFEVVGEIFKEMSKQFVSWGTLERIIAKALSAAFEKGREAR